MSEGEESSKEAVLNGHRTEFLVLQAQRAASCRVYSQRQSWQKGPSISPQAQNSAKLQKYTKMESRFTSR